MANESLSRSNEFKDKLKFALAGAVIFSIASALLSRFLVDYSVIPVVVCLVLMIRQVHGRFSWKAMFPAWGFDWLLAAWILSLTISHLVNGTLNSFEVKEIVEYRWLLCVYLFASAMLLTKVTSRYLMVFFMVVSVICAFYLADFYLEFLNIDRSLFAGRMRGLLESPTDFGHAIQFVFLFSLILLVVPFENKSSGLKLALYSAVLFSGMNLLLSYTRASWLACFLSLCVMVALFFRKIFVKIALAFVLVFGLIYGGNILGIRDRIAYSFNPTKTTDMGRLQLWQFHRDLFLDHPIFGVGYHHNYVKNFPSYNKYDIPEAYFEAHAHNQILNIMSGVGLFGAICYVLFLLLFGRLAFLNIKKAQANTLNYALAVASFILVIAFFFAGLTDTNFELIIPHYFMAFTWALIVYQRHQLKGIV